MQLTSKKTSNYGNGGSIAGHKRSRLAVNLRGMADGGEVQEPSIAGFIRYLAAGKKLPGGIDTPAPNGQPADTTAVPDTGQAATSLVSAPMAGILTRHLDEANKYADGGKIDNIHIMATKGEYMLPVDTAKAVGKKNLDKLVKATHKPIRKAGIRHMADGGQVETDDTTGAVDKYGSQLDTLKQQASGLARPGAIQEKLKPGSTAAYRAKYGAYTQQIGDLQTQYESALGTPGAVTGRALGPRGMAMNVAPVPYLRSAGINATPPVATPAPAQQGATMGSSPSSAPAAGIQPPAAPATRSGIYKDADGVYRDHGTPPPGNVARAGIYQDPDGVYRDHGQRASLPPVAEPVNASAGINVPQQTRQGPLPVLDTTTPNMNVFQAMGKLGGDMNAYRNTAIGNKQNQVDFNNTLKAGQFGISQQAESRAGKTAGIQIAKGEQDIAKGVISMKDQQRLSDLRDQYLGLSDANDKDGKKRAEIQRKANILSGKDTHDKYQPLMGKDDMGNPVFMGAFDTRTGERVQAQQNTPRYPDGQKLKGPDGKMYTVKNGVPVRD